MEETRAIRSARRREETLDSFFVQFREYCAQVQKDDTEANGYDQLRRAVKKMEDHIQGLIKARPQEKSFYISISLEFQRRVLEMLERIHQDAALKKSAGVEP